MAEDGRTEGWSHICKSKTCPIYWNISSSVSGLYNNVPHHNSTAPGSDLLPFLLVLWRWRSRQRVQERQLENTATARQVGWRIVPVTCEAGWSFQGAEGNGRWGRWWGGRRGGGGAVLSVKPTSPFPTRINVRQFLKMSLHGPVDRWATPLRPVVWGSLSIVAATAAGPRAVCRPDPFHLSARLTNVQLLHSSFRNPQGRFNLPEKEKSKKTDFPQCKHPNLFISTYLFLKSGKV